MKNCIECSNNLIKDNNQVKYCSSACRNYRAFKIRKNRPANWTKKSLNGNYCLCCGLALFGRNSSYCSKACSDTYVKINKISHRNRQLRRSQSAREYMKTLRGYYNRKEALTLDFLEQLFIEQGGCCAISGEPLTYLTDRGRCSTNISIDRIDSSKDYTPDNVQLVCYRVNQMKMEGTEEELKTWCRKILKWVT